MTEIIKQSEVESGSNNQLIGNFQTENSCGQRSEAKVNSGVPYKKMCIVLSELIKFISTSSIIKHIHIF